ncbi:MAG: ABC transporter ATP-binding protein, partial [Prevotella sp.]|nr:ABC transporter ATP-binding protein [Prevotella sp.]
MIKLQNISKIFHSEEFDTVALNGVNLEVKQG